MKKLLLWVWLGACGGLLLGTLVVCFEDHPQSQEWLAGTLAGAFLGACVGLIPIAFVLLGLLWVGFLGAIRQIGRAARDD